MYYGITGMVYIIYDDNSLVFPNGVTQGSLRCDLAHNYHLMSEHSYEEKL